MKKISFIAAILICGLLYTTCDLLKDMVKEPEVNLESVEFSEIDFTGLTLLSKVSVKNNNSISIPLPKIDWDLKIIDIPFVDGIIQSTGPLKANDSTVVQFPVSFTYENLINIITSLTDENAKYKINMVLHIPIQELGDLTFQFDHEDKVPLLRLPEITVASRPSTTFSNYVLSVPTSATISFALDIKNKSNIAVKFNDLSYDFKVGSNSLSKGGVTSKPTINSNTTERIPISFTISGTDLLAVGVSAITGNNFSYNLTGNYKFSLPDLPLIKDKEFGDSFTFQ